MLRKQKGNMYDFVTHTWNAIKGKCSHDCKYCYMKSWGQLKPVRLDTKELKTDLGKDNFIFVGSSTDMFADDVNKDWIKKTLIHCNKYSDNKYLFQTKNLKRLMEFIHLLPENSVIGTTIESNIIHPEMGNTPFPIERAFVLKQFREKGFKTMVTIEPILDFDVTIFAEMIVAIQPTWINIGADSKGHKLREPSKEKILQFVKVLKSYRIEIKNKENIKRLLK